MNNTRWFIFAGIVAVLIGLLIFTREPAPTFEGDPAKVVEGDHVYGNRDAKVVLIEYGDFQCPGCASLYPTLKQVKEEYKDKVAVVFRHLPLTNIHPNAKAAAASAVAASRQDKFWEMHDKLYENQARWESATTDQRSSVFAGFAQELGLNMDKYRADAASTEVVDRVNRDFSAAKKAGIQLSTPTLVLNGQQLELNRIQTGGQYDAVKLREVLNGALREVGEQPPKLTTQEKAPAGATPQP